MKHHYRQREKNLHRYICLEHRSIFRIADTLDDVADGDESKYIKLNSKL